MATFEYLLGKRVEVCYRAGDVHMTISGNLAIDTGNRIQLEERFSQGGRSKTLRIEVPYGSIVRIREVIAQPQLQPAP
ncbi:MAG TPA: hypothetical protein VFU57_06520 [Candidatus Acidoferrales bacterium]|nr:hypothetical protein [Candidatus Acidoferrales bacterium]